MEFQKSTNFLDTTFDGKDLPRFVTKNGLKFMINQEDITMLIKKLDSKRQCKELTYAIILMRILL